MNDVTCLALCPKKEWDRWKTPCMLSDNGKKRNVCKRITVNRDTSPILHSNRAITPQFGPRDLTSARKRPYIGGNGHHSLPCCPVQILDKGVISYGNAQEK